MITNFELMFWLATGKGLAKLGNHVYNKMDCNEDLLFNPIVGDVLIRTWDNPEWQVPTLELMKLSRVTHDADTL